MRSRWVHPATGANRTRRWSRRNSARGLRVRREATCRTSKEKLTKMKGFLVMNRSLVMVAVCAALGTLAGCAAHGSPPVAIVSPNDTGISVSAEGEARATPDVAILRLGIEAHRPSMEEARSASATAQQ